MRINLIRNLLRIGAVGGVFATAYFSAKRGTAICDTFKIVEDEYRFKEEPGNKVIHYIRNAPRLIKPLWPTIACAAGTITCMAVSEHMSYKQIAALTASCIYFTKNRDFLENKLKEVVGEEKLEEIKKEFLAKEIQEPIKFPSVEITGNGDLLCIETYSGRWFRSSEPACLEAQRKLKEQYEETGYACMNDYYQNLNITETQFGYERGWARDSGFYGPDLTFENTLIEPYELKEEWFGPEGANIKERVLVLEFPYFYYPMEHWMEY